MARANILHLQESYLATMANLAPLVTKFSAATANKLLGLFLVFSSPRYLFAKERNYNRLFYLLYILDTIIQYQYVGNAQIVYTFVRNRDKVLQLRDMTFDSAKEAVEKLRNQKLENDPKGKKPEKALESPTGFVPTATWFEDWRQRLPIQVLSTLVESLSPAIEKYCIDNDLNSEGKVLEYLKSKTMVGILPQPHPLITHSFVYSVAMHKWTSAYFWGSVYMKSLDIQGEIAKICPSLWAGTKVRLFGVTVE